jgi:sulfur carrier protein ThiS
VSSEIQVSVPEFLVGGDSFSRAGERLTAAGLAQLRVVLASSHESVAAKLWDENGAVRRNVLLVRNGEVVPRTGYDTLMFDDRDEIEFLVQFAGG